MFTSAPARPTRPRTPPRLQPRPDPRQPGPPPRRPRRTRERTYERILGWSLVGSLLVHLLLLLLSPLFVRMGEPPGGPVTQAERAPREEIQLLNPVATPGAPDLPLPQATDEAAPGRAESRSTQREAAPVSEPGGGVQQAPGATAAPASPSGGSLRPGLRDPRLWVDARETPVPERSDRQRYMEHLQARIDAINDSIAGDADRARRATDWTVKDGQGRRWGIAPDGIHLGGVRVPVPIAPGATGDNQSIEAAREEQRRREEIRRQEEARERRRRSGDGGP